MFWKRRPAPEKDRTKRTERRARPWPFPQRRSVRPGSSGTHPGVTGSGDLAGYVGADLTQHISTRGLQERLIEETAAQRATILGTTTFAGRNLTNHHDPKDKRSPLTAIEHRPPLGQTLRHGVVEALRWLFTLKPKILIIERYVWGEVFGFFLLGVMGFTFFLIVTSIFGLGEKIFSKNIPPFTVTKVLLLSAPNFLVLAIPVAVLFATLMAMGRFNRDNEVVAMTTNGISLYRLMVPFIAVAVVGGVLTWLTYDEVVPPTLRASKELLKIFWQAQVVGFIKEDTVIKAPDRKYFYVDRINKTEGIMYGVRLYDYFAGETKPKRNFPRIFLAEEASVADGYLILQDVTIFNLDEFEGDTLVSARMPEVRVDISTKLSVMMPRVHGTELSASELRTRIQRGRDRLAGLAFPNPVEKKNYLEDWTEYYYKFSVPIASLVLVLVAVPVSLRGPRDERNLAIILSFLLMMAYYIVFFTCREIGKRGIILSKDFNVGGVELLSAGTNLLPPYIAGWLPPAAFAVAAAILLVRARK